MKLIFLNLKSTLVRLYEWFKVIFLYYRRSLKFVWIDSLIASQYLLKSPHRYGKSFNIIYGETPLTTLDKICRECRILSKDVVYELGCGSGRSCFWLQNFVKCQVIGIDLLPPFIDKALRVKRWASLENLDFQEQNILDADLRRATVIYLYGTCLEDPFIKKLATHFELQLRSKTRIITVSYPLTDYSDHFKVSKQFTARFPWGEAEVFLNLMNRVDGSHRDTSVELEQGNSQCSSNDL